MSRARAGDPATWRIPSPWWRRSTPRLRLWRSTRHLPVPVIGERAARHSKSSGTGRTAEITLATVMANQWVAFGGTYWRLWGGVKTGSQPKSVIVRPDGKYVFVNNVGFHDRLNVFQYDPVTLEQKAIAKFPGNAIEQVITADSKTLFVSNFYHKQVVALDTDTLEVIRTYKVKNLPKGMALSPDEKTLYVSNWADDTTSVVDLTTGEAVKHIRVGDRPRGTAITNDGTKLYVGNFLGHSISIIDVAQQKVVKTIAPCKGPRDAVPTADGKYMMFSCYWQPYHLLAIDTQTDEVVHRTPMGRGPKTLGLSNDQRFAFTANYNNSTMTITDLTSWETLTIPVPTVKTCGLAVSPDDRRVYLTGFDSDNLLVMERLMPGEKPGPLGPKAPGPICYRSNRADCTKYP